MLNRVFNPDNFFFRILSKAVDVVLLGLLWLVCSLPLITLGASTSALYYTTVKCVRGNENGTFRAFFHSFRDNFKPALPLSLLTVGLWILLEWGYRIILSMANSEGGMMIALYMMYLVMLVVPLGVLCWVYPLLSRFSMGPGKILAAAFRLAIGHLPTTTLLVLLLTTAINFCRVYWYFYLIPVILCPGILALLFTVFLERTLKAIAPQTPADPETVESGETEEAEMPEATGQRSMTEEIWPVLAKEETTETDATAGTDTTEETKTTAGTDANAGTDTTAGTRITARTEKKEEEGSELH